MTSKVVEIIVLIAIFIATFILVEYEKVANYYDDLAHVYFLNVGHGDSSLIKTENRDLILIDGGKSDYLLYEIGQILPFWVKDFDLVVVTHSDYDHISGIYEVIQRYNVQCILYESTDDPKSETERKLRELIEDKGLKHFSNIRDYNNNWEYCLSSNDLSNYSLRSVSDESSIKNSNDESIVSMFKFEDFQALFTGDLETNIAEKLIAYVPVDDIEILKIPHQGSKDALYEEIIYRFSPDVGILSVGKNGYGHPHAEVIDTYIKNNVSLLRTDEEGTIHFISDGFSWFIEN